MSTDRLFSSLNGQLLEPGGRDPSGAHVNWPTLTGDGVFETLRVTNGTPLALTRHLARLTRSAAAMTYPAPELAAIRSWISAVVHANEPSIGSGDYRMRIDYAVVDGTETDQAMTVIIRSSPTPTRGRTARADIAPWPQNENASEGRAKSTEYAMGAVAARWARDRGLDEVIFLNTAGHVVEGITSNIFAVIDGKICTPTLQAGCLPGVTRELVLEWLEVQEQVLTLEHLVHTQEAFITSATREIQPLRELAGVKLPAPGPVTAAGLEIFNNRMARQPDP